MNHPHACPSPDEDGRLEELARMLSGATVTDEARAAAGVFWKGERV
jgi:DNA repair ATPase RecN